MSFSNPIPEKIYLFMDSLISPIGQFFNEICSEVKEVWIHKKKAAENPPQEAQEEEKMNEKQALLQLKSFKSIKKGTLLFFGLENAGKTAFLRRFTKKGIEDIVPTQGFNVYSLQFHGFVLTCWDFGGNKSLREYWENYISEDVSGIFYTIDGSDESKVQENIDVLCLILNMVVSMLGKHLPVFVFANKADLGMKVNVQDFVNEVKKQTNYEGTILGEEGSVLNWVNVEESMGCFLEFIK